MLNLNKEMQESIKTNQLIISISDNDWNKLNTIKIELQQKYKKQLSELNHSSNTRRYYDIKIIGNVLKFHND